MWDNSCLLNERTEGELDTEEGRKFHIRIWCAEKMNNYNELVVIQINQFYCCVCDS